MTTQRHIFISYARGDGEDFATQLRQRLVTVFGEEQLWQDRARMEGGVGWWQQITNALDEVAFMVLVATPAAMASPVVAREWRYARQQGVCVYPVQVPGLPIDFTALPRWMRDSHFYNLEKEWDTFIAYLRAPCQAVKVPFHGVPDKPEHFVARPKEFEAIKTKLLDMDRQNPVAITTALQGAGGFGKTTLAAALCHDDEVQTAFDDGVLWVTLGENPNLVNLFTSLYDALTGERIAFIDVEDASSKFAEKLADKDCLLVIDDVWNAAHLRPFLRKAVGGEDRTARLVTTRLLDIAISTGSKPVEVDEMTTDQATTMLAAGLPEDYDKSGFHTLAQRLGEWPLMLEIANGMLRERVALGNSSTQALEWVNKTLDRRGVRGIRRDNESERKQDAAGVLTASIALLTVDEAQWLKELSIFKDDLDIPLRALMSLWNLDDFDTEEVVSRLARAGLIRFNAGSGTLRLHDVIRAYLIEQLGSEWRATHKKLTDNWGDAYQLPDTFAWRWYIHHLCLAGRVDRVTQLLFDYRWLSTKLNQADMNVNFLLMDCDELLTSLTQDNELKTAVHLLRSALSLSAHVLADHKEQLALQLSGRLYTFHEKARVSSLLQSIIPTSGSFWPFHPAATHQPAGSLLLRILEGHKGSVRGALALADGRLLSWADDRTLRLWDSNGQPLAVLEGHTNAVRGALVLADGRLLSWAYEPKLRLWDKNGQSLAVLEGHTYAVRGALALPDGRLLSWAGNTYSSDHTLRLWDNNGQLLTVLKGHKGSVNGALVLPDGRLLSWANDRTLRLWDGNRQSLTVLEGHTDAVNGVLALPDGRLLSWAGDVFSSESTLRLWDSNGQPLAVLEGHANAVRGALALPDGRLLSWADDSTLRLWDSNGQPLAVLEGHTNAVRGALALSDGRLLSWANDRTLRLWDTEGQPLTVLKGHEGSVNRALALPDGRLLSWANDSTLRLWDSNGQPLTILKGHEGSVNGALVLADGRLLSWANDRMLRLWDSNRQSLTVLEWHTNAARGALALSDGRLLSWADDSTLRLWDTEGQLLTTLAGHTNAVNGALALHDGRLLSWANDHTLRLWDDNGRLMAVLAGHTNAVRGALVLHYGRLLSWADDSTLRLWDSNGQSLAILRGHIDPVNGALALADGRLLSWADDSTLRLWDSNGLPLVLLAEHTNVVNGVLVLADGRLLSWANDGTLRLWDSNGRPLAVLEGHTNAVNGVLALPDGRLLSWADDSTLRLWDSSGRPLAVLEWHTNAVRGALALADGYFLSWTNDSTLWLWDKEGQLLSILAGHTNAVRGALALPNGCFLSWADDSTLRLWDNNGQLLTTFYGDALIKYCVILDEQPLRVAVGDSQGRVLFLKLVE